MVGLGRSRELLAQHLSTAYGEGLLSDETYLQRVDELLAAPLLDPDRLAGDLHLRPAADDAVTARFARLREWVRDAVADAPRALLALDWSGATSELTLGRHRSCDVVLADPLVSRRHAQLRFRDGRWIVRDLTSTNGTIVNGTRVGRSQLRPGDRLDLGGTRLRIE
jgi:hypothetical protein